MHLMLGIIPYLRVGFSRRETSAVLPKHRAKVARDIDVTWPRDSGARG